MHLRHTCVCIFKGSVLCCVDSRHPAILGSNSRLSDSTKTLGGVKLCIHYIFDSYTYKAYIDRIDLQLVFL